MASFQDILLQKSGVVPGQQPETDVPQSLEMLNSVAGTSPDDTAVKLKQGLPADADTDVSNNAFQQQLMKQKLLDARATDGWLSDPNHAMLAHDSVDQLSTIEKISRGFDRGIAQNDLELAEAKYINKPNPETQKLVDDANKSLEALGPDNSTGFTSFLVGAASMVGTYAAALKSPEAAASIAGGGALGATLGAVGGPLAPVTSSAGAITGMAVGAAYAIARNSYLTRSVSSYTDMIKLGIDPKIAQPLAIGVGLINSALDVTSLNVVAAPVKAGIKSMFKAALGDVVKSPKVVSAAKNFALSYGETVAAGTVIGVVQEGMQIAAEEIGKALDDKQLEHATPEQIFSRLEDTAVSVFKGMAVLALPGPAFNLLAQKKAASAALKHQKLMDQFQEAMTNSNLAIRDFEAASSHADAVMKKAQVNNVYIDADALGVWIENQPDPQAAATMLGVTDQLEAAQKFGHDVAVPIEAFNRHILPSKDYAEISDFVKTDPNAMNAREAKEFEESGLEQSAEEALERSSPEGETSSDVSKAAEDLGLNALFRTADEAGLTPKEYEAYLAKVEAARIKSESDFQEMQLKRQLQENKAAIEAQKQKAQAGAEEHLRQQPVYQAINGLGKDRLDMALTAEHLLAQGKTLSDLPRQEDGRRLYGEAKENGLDPEAYADYHGFDSAADMFDQMIKAQKFKDAVAVEAQKQLAENAHDLLTKKSAILDAIEAVHNDAKFAQLHAELNILQARNGDKKTSAKALKAAVRRELYNTQLKDLSPGKFLALERKYAAAAGRAVRNTNRQGRVVERAKPAKDGTPAKPEVRKIETLSDAAKLKYRQILNYEMAKQAIAIEKRLASQHKFVSGFLKNSKKWTNMRPVYLEAIREYIKPYMWGKSATVPLKALVSVIKDPVDPIPYMFDNVRVDNPFSYKQMTLGEWNDLYENVKAIRKAGTDEEKFRKADERHTVDFVAQHIAGRVQENLKKLERGDAPKTTNKLRAWRDTALEYHSAILNMDTIVRMIDGFKENGWAYNYLKRPYDKAMSTGYLPGKKGYLPRQQEAMKAVRAIFDKHFTKKERIALANLIKVPGIDRSITKDTYLSTLLNLGNDLNRKAMVKSGTWTPEELDAIVAHSTKKDMDFVQDVWNYLDTFWPEVEQSSILRRNVRPAKRINTPLETPHGTYEGGYFPIIQDKRQASVITETEMQDAFDDFRSGKHVVSTTAHGHTLEARGSGRFKIALHLSNIDVHVNRVIFDLEVGDAVRDIYRVLFHNDTKNAFLEQGQDHVWQAMKVWFQNAVTDELAPVTHLEKAARWVRTGFTVSKLAWNFGVMAQQPLGTLQSAVYLGKRNVLTGWMTVLRHPLTIGNSINDVSPFMRSRDITWHKDINDARKVLNNTVLDKYTPGKTADLIRHSLFYGIIKMQKIADIVTWVAAKHKALELFPGDEARGIEYADRAVARTQSSAIFGDRSAFERGNWGRSAEQSEIVRLFTPMMSYMISKYNIATERVKKTNFHSPGSIANLAVDMAILYSVEAIIGDLIKGQFYNDNEDPSLVGSAIHSTAQAVTGQFPIIKDLASQIYGYAGGGALGSLGDQGQKFTQAMDKGDVARMFKSANNILGALMFYPSAQINKTIGAIEKASSGEETSLLEFVFGPTYKKSQ